MWQNTVRRKARFESFAEVIDLDGKPKPLPASNCEVEEHHDHVALRFGASDQRVVRISHERFNAFIGSRQVVYLSW